MSGPLERSLHSVTSHRAALDYQRALIASATALSIVLALQCERVFVPTMIFVIDQSNRTELGLTAAVVFLAIALGALLVRGIGAARAAVVSAILLVACRLAVQFVERPSARWQIAALGVIAGGWLVMTLTTGDRDALAAGIAFGFVLDLALRAGFDTIDLTYMANFTKDTVSVLLAGVLIPVVLVLELPGRATEGTWLDSLPLLGIGAGIGSYALISGNLGLVAVRAGYDLQSSLWLLSLGPIAAIALWIFPIRLARGDGSFVSGPVVRAAIVIVAGAFGLAGVIEPPESNSLVVIAIVLFCFSTTWLTMLSTRGRIAEQRYPWIWKSGALFTLGMLVHAISVFLYFSGSGSFVFAAMAYAVLGCAALVAAWNPADQLSVNYRRYLAPASIVAIAFVSALIVSDADVASGSMAELDSEFTVVTYNIQNGFSRDNVWDLEAIARTIESLDPDIVLLQESGRGWFALGWSDQVWWLGQRLDMEFAFGAASRDDLWGNAILSKAPIVEPETLKYASVQNLNRSVVSARIPIASSEVWVASTHLDNPSGADEVRMDQAEQLIAEWGNVQPSVIGGDFNANPESDVIMAMIGAGLLDAAAEAGDPETTSESGNRIDYVFVTPDLEIAGADVPDVWTSDHRPVAVRLRYSGA